MPLVGCLISHPFELHLMTKPNSINPRSGTMGSTAFSARIVPVRGCCFSSTDPCANSTNTVSEASNSCGVPLRSAFVAPPSKRPVGPSEGITRFTFTALLHGFNVFNKVEASVMIPDTFSGFPPFSLPSVRFDVSHPRDTSAVAAAFEVFSGLSWTPEPFPFSGVPLPSLLVVLATFFGVSFLGFQFPFFTGQSVRECPTPEQLKHLPLLGSN